jgi:putative ABC transport system substrate-binding protein
MRRREFIAGLGGVAGWPLAARAQQRALPIIGYLQATGDSVPGPGRSAFYRGLAEMGFVEGRNVAVEVRSAEGQYDRLPAFATDLVRREVAVIFAQAIPAAVAAKTATTKIPIVFTTGADPVALGLVASLSRPGGNVTGVTSLSVELGPKRLELLRQLDPMATVMALLVNPINVNAESESRDALAAARTLGLQLRVLHASTERDFDTAFASLVQQRARGLVIGIDAFFSRRMKQLAALALRYRVPAIYQRREFAAAGGLMSYGGSVADRYRLAGVYAGRILNGEKPSDLPVQQDTKIELTINMKTAKALGLTVPETLLATADQVIQ